MYSQAIQNIIHSHIFIIVLWPGDHCRYWLHQKDGMMSRTSDRRKRKTAGCYSGNVLIPWYVTGVQGVTQQVTVRTAHW
jgi:hypothetical protein